MSLIIPGKKDHPSGLDCHPAIMGKDENKCFYCCYPFERGDSYVEWMGAIGDILLHPECVVEMMLRMMRDVHEYECLVGKAICQK